MQLPQVIEVQGKRVLMTRQLAEAYGTEMQIISNNYTRNKKRYVIGKHVIILEGEELKEFKAEHQIDDNLKFAHTLYLWTEKGALLHAKSLNTDKAWQVYDYLVDFYFRIKEEKAILTSTKSEEKELVGQVGAREKLENPKGIDIEPVFREIISALPVDSLDAMEKVFRLGNSKVIKIATTEILVEKMKRVMAEIK